VFSTMTYTFVIASLFGTVCLTQPVDDDVVMPSAVEQVYKVGTYPKTEYYQPIYVDTSDAHNTITIESTSIYETLLNET